MNIEIFEINTEIKENSIFIKVKEKGVNEALTKKRKKQKAIKSAILGKYREVEVKSSEIISLEDTGSLGLELQLKDGEVDRHRLSLVAQKIKKDFKLPLSD